MSFQFILIVHMFLALSLIVLILMQHGKGADAGAAFGAGVSGSVFGVRGANSFLYKLITGLSLGFFLTSLTLAYLATHDGSIGNKPISIMEQVTTGKLVVPDVPIATVTPILNKLDVIDIPDY
ncbi:preprotein translocase subunit SecG [Candidatus Vesicomyidisocius calyptogenae]|nr:preprotein translocase subunit SecG [Candidatus Vesicomyosocius okutanii]